VPVHIHAARGDLVQQRLPDVGARLIDERHIRKAVAGEPVSEARGEFEAARATADDYDAMRTRQGLRIQD
jgi:hypothetical protein